MKMAREKIMLTLMSKSTSVAINGLQFSLFPFPNIQSRELRQLKQID
jgi:hypothetical protein